MKWLICSVFDEATQIFGRPVFVRAQGEALRSFMDEAQNKESAIGQHPNDYELYQMGFFDDGTGEFETDRPMLMFRGKEVSYATQQQEAGKPATSGAEVQKPD